MFADSSSANLLLPEHLLVVICGIRVVIYTVFKNEGRENRKESSRKGAVDSPAYLHFDIDQKVDDY